MASHSPHRKPRGSSSSHAHHHHNPQNHHSNHDKYGGSNNTGVAANPVSQQAYNEIVNALSKDMPMIMHGSGDVVPWETNPESKMLLSQLTANYISNLVEAAVDAHSILNGGRRPPLPPPPPAKAKDHRQPPLPAPYVWPASTSTAAGKAASKKKPTKRDGGPTNPENFKRRRRDVDYWDEPLPEPKIKNKAPRLKASSAPTNKDIDGVPIGDWVGVAGVDFFEESRARSAHVAQPHAIGTQNFIFPVCHDSALYGKILDVQGARRSMEPVLANATIRDVIRNEGALQGAGALRKRRRDKKSSSAGRGAKGDDDDEDEDDVADDEPEATDSEDEDTGAVWPGLDELLPAHTTKDFLKSLM